ncbi:MAG TPA: tetratricopeptide repeat protein [Lachnospiraceae bacterium]|nr:tetratricopeptide repeat protein [Lachnospiraceae bacterium]
MKKLNYRTIILYLVKQCKLTNKEIADDLDVDQATISRVKTGKQSHIAKSMDADFFYESVFSEKSNLRDEQFAVGFYEYLDEQECLNDYIKTIYFRCKEKCHEQEPEKSDETYKEFILSVLKEADRYSENSPVPDTPACLQKTDPAQHITLEKFASPIEGNIFIGREKIVEQIHATLKQWGTGIIYGIGGLGKSYCSLRYAELYKREYTQVQQIFFSTDIKNTISKIRFRGLDESHASEEEKLKKRFALLESYSEDTLLIIDNMDVIPQDRENYERLKNMQMRVLFTSREADLDHPKYMIPIEPLSQEEQRSLFEHFSEFTISDEDLPKYHTLFEKVAGHTLLLELIAKTMAASDTTLEEMLHILSSTKDIDISKVSIAKDNKYQQAQMDQFVSMLFDLSELNEKQKNILMHLSLVSIDGIRRRLFKELLKVENNDINGLINQSWIIKDNGNGPASVKIHLHPVICSAVIKNTDPSLEKCHDFIERITEQCERKGNTPFTDSDRSDLCNILIEAGEMFVYDENYSVLLLRQTDVLWKARKYIDAYNLCKKGISVIAGSENMESELKIRYYEKAGDIAVRLARYNDALNHYQNAVEITKNSNIRDPQKLVELYDSIGFVLRKDSKYEKALDYYTKAQNLVDLHDISDISLTAALYNDMGIIYINLQMYEKALEYYQKAKDLRENAENPDKEQLAYSYHNIGTVYQKQGNYKQAIEDHKKALEIREEIYSGNEPIIASSLTMIGNDYTEAAKNDPAWSFDKAYNYFTRSLDIRIAALGENHPDTAWSYQSIGRWYFYQGRYTETLENYFKCKEIRKNILGGAHAYTAEILYCIGEVYAKTGDFSEAQKYLTEALKIQENLNNVRAKEKTSRLLDEIINR